MKPDVDSQVGDLFGAKSVVEEKFDMHQKKLIFKICTAL